MDFSSLIEKRESTRNYDPNRSIPKKDILYCLEAVRLAPSASNAQSFFFHICEGEKAKKVAKATQSLGMNRFTDQAPMMVVISEASYNITAAAGARVRDQDYRALDIGIAAIHFCLAATEKNLGTCMLGWFDEKRIQNILGIKERIRLVISVGYPMDASIRKKSRKPLKKLTDFAIEKR